MLEIRYDVNTKVLTGWWADRHVGGEIKLKNRPEERIILLDIPIPDKPLDAWLFDNASKSLMPNPNYTEPIPKRDLAAEMDDLRTRVKKLENE